VSIGLDLGSTRFRSLRRDGGRLLGCTCRPVYLSIPDSPGHRRLLERDEVSFAECDGALILLGDAAEEWSKLLQANLVPLLPDGQLPASDPFSRQILSLMIDAMLPAATFSNETCCFTVPGELMPAVAGPEREFFSRLVALRGYRPAIVGQGMAVVLAELADAGFTGIGISLGASQCEFALVRNGIEHARCAIPWGTSEIAADLAVEEAAAQSVRPSSTSIADRILTYFLVELLLEAGARIGQNDGFRILTQPVAITCTGGITARLGFETLLQQAWQRAAWPIHISGLRVAADALYTVARGCLIQAKLAAQAATRRAA
jgi:hypothetical protein